MKRQDDSWAVTWEDRSALENAYFETKISALKINDKTRKF